MPVVDPSNGFQIAMLCEADEHETGLAVEAAHRAFVERRWSGKSVLQKQQALRRLAELVQGHIDELAWLECLNTGIPLGYLRNIQIPRVVRNLNFYADSLSQHSAPSVVDPNFLRYVAREPIGAVALISPWNAPLALASTKLAAALAFGNTCLIKTAEQTPLAIARFMELTVEADFPPGVVNLVNGRGSVTGNHLVKHPLVRAISFTGGTETGRHIAAAAAHGLTRVDLELGGKSANIISASANIEDAVKGAIASIFTNNGQQCFAGSRILVEREIAPRFIEAFIERAKQIRVGSPFSPDTEIGPLANLNHLQRVTSFFGSARSEGLEILTGGGRPPGLDAGYYVEPTVVLTTSNASRLSREEVFGPLATVQVVESFDQALLVANDSDYGLAAYLWTNDLSQSLRAAERLQAGMVLVNASMTVDLRLPFGGYKNSGLGREGYEGFRNLFTQEKTVSIAVPAVS
ncbi:5-carboxymethyl-2-hydroxymuconate semialdehyde dehydrogenase [Pigmentiphaga daeguensis]|uniref:5-carboxymethyl-2-hydroxymuconate semialdehyde dehydrogenase n=1 Tax=Pigmentiphaga daeguensis TaxID=414049 RepID=A0ABN1BS65_9BURK